MEVAVIDDLVAGLGCGDEVFEFVLVGHPAHVGQAPEAFGPRVVGIVGLPLTVVNERGELGTAIGADADCNNRFMGGGRS